MTCQETQARLADHLSGELPRRTVRRLERHLGACPACSERLEAERALRARLRQAVNETAPTALRIRIRGAIEQLEAGRSPFSGLFHGCWPRLTAAAVTAAVLAFLALSWLAAPPRIMADSVNMHRRFVSTGFMAGPTLRQVPAILAWSEQKLGYAVPRPMLPQPSPEPSNDVLAGGICPLVKQQAAYLTYSYGGRVVSLFMLRHPTHTLRGTRRVVVQGREYFVGRFKKYNAVLWEYRGTTCILVSDLQPETLLDLSVKVFPQQPDRSTTSTSLMGARVASRA